MTPKPKIVWSPRYEVDIGLHVFPTRKYRLIRDALLAKGSAEQDQFIEPTMASWDDLALAHSEAYLGRIREGSLSASEQVTLELPFSDHLREASRLCCGGTTDAARHALADGVGVHLGGGFHHAFRDHGEGFCLLNDVAVTLMVLLEEGRIERAAVVDLDVHQGNGTAAIFAEEPEVFTFSMHQERNYPTPKETGDLDIGLDDGIRDSEYLRILKDAFAMTVNEQEPELILYLAGADPYVDDQLGGLWLTREGLENRDRLVLDECSRLGIPVAVLLAGGYARQEEDTVAIHSRTIELALGL